VLPDQKAKLAADEGRGHRLLVLDDLDPGLHADRVENVVEHLAHLGGLLAFLDRLGSGSLGRVGGRNHPRRRVADAQQPALALGDHLKPNRRLVDPRLELLELAQRCPLRLTNRFARRLDLEAHRRAFLFFLRLTRRGCAGAAGAGAGSGATAGAGATSFGGVREVRRSGGCGRGTSRRVIKPWPTVHRFVVTQ
jgi:hypothetical protein